MIIKKKIYKFKRWQGHNCSKNKKSKNR